MAETKSSSIKSPFSDAVVKHGCDCPKGSDKASPPKHMKEAELYHRKPPKK